eukprot:g14981.t1
MGGLFQAIEAAARSTSTATVDQCQTTVTDAFAGTIYGLENLQLSADEKARLMQAILRPSAMTNYSKWDKFAADLASDTEEEEERELEKYTSKTACFIHVPPGDFTKKEQLCKLLEEDPDFEAPSSTAAGIVTEDAEPEPGVSRALKKYKWQSVTSSFIPGYAPGGGSDDLWRLFFDDNFLTTQTEPNRAARALLGYKSLGSFVVSCAHQPEGGGRPHHASATWRISREHEDQKARMDAFSKLGGQTVELISQDSEAFKTRPFVDGAKTLIGGQVKPWTGIFSEIYSPVYCTETGERICIGKQATMSPKEAMEAVHAAAKAWDLGRGEWPQKSLQERIAVVERLVGKLKEKRMEIAKVLQWEICKNEPWTSTTGVSEGIHAILKRSPMGVMMNLGPSNYPFNETYATLIPAILMGNSIVMKVPNTGGLAHFLTMEAYAECFPPGVVNFISGRGRDTMPPCMESGLVDIFAFIGSSKAADALVKAHPQPHRLKNLLSLDAKNLAIVLPDADLDVAVKEIVAGSTSFNGQRCTAIKLVMVHSSIAETFNQKFCSAVAALPCGLPFGKNHITPLACNPTSFMQSLTEDPGRPGQG